MHSKRKSYNNYTLYMEEIKKIKVSQDWLYKFLKEHHFVMAVLSRRMGVSDAIVRGCFHHNKNRLGKPMSFSAKNIVLLNAALQQIAGELSQCLLTFGSDQTFTNQRGTTYDPACVAGMKRINEYFKLNGLTQDVLGWNVVKCRTTLFIEKSPVYGNITKEDADRVNAELLSVAGVLSSYEVVTDEGSSPNDGGNNNDNTLKNKAKRKTMESSYEAPKYEWDNTSLGLPERSAMLRQRWPNGILLFRVNGGYTIEGDDARTVHELLPDVHPYTNPESGMTTAYMSKEQMAQVLSQFISQERRVIITDMYKE